MTVPLWAALSLILGALLLGTTFAHVLEIRAKASMDGALWTTLQQRLYRSFATIGGAIEIGAILTTAALAWTVEGQGRGPAIGAFLCFAVAFAVVWIGMVLPVNRVVLRWDPTAVPAGWQGMRRRWDTGHGIRFALHLVGFGLLVWLSVFCRPWS